MSTRNRPQSRMDNTIEGETDAPRSIHATILADIVDLAARHKAEGDRLRQLPPALAEAFHHHDIYRLILPRDLGGGDIAPLDYLDLVEKVARVDGSTAWNLAIGAGSGLYVGYLPVERSRPMVADASCCIAGAYAPFGRGEIVEGGYRVSGHWGWASGVAQARWVVFGFRVVGREGLDGADEKPLQIRQALAPREAFRVLDTWHVSGLRGTGSAEYEVKDLFVPSDMTFRVFLDQPKHPGLVFRLPAAFFASAVASVALGIGQGTVEGLKQLAAVKVGFAGSNSLREQAYAQYAVAKAEALNESANLYLRDAIAAIWDGILAGHGIDSAERKRARRACVQAAEASAEAVDLCCRAVGGHALFESQPYERALRDVRAATAQITLQRSAMEDAGRAAFGLKPLSPVF
jgi:alkylation response protein AidB-like acyl-CoA dehydrogenase